LLLLPSPIPSCSKFLEIQRASDSPPNLESFFVQVFCNIIAYSAQ